MLEGTASANTNIALIKYWGKHPKWEEYHVPTKSSLSLTANGLGTHTKVVASPGKGHVKKFILNGRETEGGKKEKVERFIQKLGKYVMSDVLKYDYEIITDNNIITASGFASSASGFAALASALLSALSSEHSEAEEILSDFNILSAVARLGSGSAARSIHGGAVLWKRGWDEENFDPVYTSHTVQILSPKKLEDIVLLYVVISEEEKKVSSTGGMKRSIETVPFYWEWVEAEEKEIKSISEDLKTGKIENVFETTMKCSNSLHAICLATYPPIKYLTDASWNLINTIHELNAEYGTIAAYTFDAGPNCVILTVDDMSEIVMKEVKKSANEIKITKIGGPVNFEC